MGEVVLLLGSNIRPEENIRQAVALLRSNTIVSAVSSIWITAAVGTKGPDFLNAAVSIQTNFDFNQLKYSVLRPLEQMLGRIRFEDKNSPRTIDMDIILFNGEVIDENLWKLPHIAIPVAELVPNIVYQPTRQKLVDIATDLSKSVSISRHPDL